MNTKHLKYLIEIQRCGSVNAAAQKCFIAQSHLSRILQSIEREIGFPLFSRSNNSLEITQGGYLFFKSIEKIVEDCDAIENIPSYLEISENLSLACSPSQYLTQCYFEFKRLYPISGSNDIYREAGLKQLFELLTNRQIRLSYMVMSANTIEKYKQMAKPYSIELQMIEKNLVLYALMHRKHPLASKSFIVVKEFAQYPFVSDVEVDFEDTKKLLSFSDAQNFLSVSSRSTLMDALRYNNSLTVQIRADDKVLQDFGLCQKPIYDINTYMTIYLAKSMYLETSEYEKKYIQFTNTKIHEVYNQSILCKS